MKSCADARPRAKNAAATRAAMLAAAKRRFLAESYENVGLRDVAGDVGVDVALVSRYFGSKEGLFREVLHVDKPEKDQDVEAEDLPAFLTSLSMEQGRAGDRDNVERLLIILRSASSPQASEIVRRALSEDVLKPLAQRIGGAFADTRASLAMAVWMGTTILRTVMAVEPLCDGECGVTNRKLQELFEAALSEPSGNPERCNGW